MHKQLPNPDQIDNIIFDFGGVLFDIDYDAPVRAFKALGFENFDQLYAQAKQSDLFDRLETGKISNPDFLKEIASKFSGQNDLQSVELAWNSILLDIPKGRVELIHELKEKFDCYLLSNTNSIHVQAFEKIVDKSVGLDYFKSAFVKTYYSNDIGIKKPYPSTYIELCGWHDLNVERTLFIDDSIQHVVGAHEAGLNAFHLEVDHEDIRDVLKTWV